MNLAALATSLSLKDRKPEDVARDLVEQFLLENGYEKALHAMQRENEDRHSSVDSLPRSALMQVVWKLCESQLEDVMRGISLDPTCAAEQTHGGPALLPVDISRHHVLFEHLASNPTDMAMTDGLLFIATGGGEVHAYEMDPGCLVWSTLCGSPLISIDASGSGQDLLLATSSMASVVTLLSRTGRILHQLDLNSRLLPKLCWCGDRPLLLVSTGKASLMLLYAAWSSDSQGDGDARTAKLRVEASLKMRSNVTDVVFLEPELLNGQPFPAALCARRNSASLSLCRLTVGEGDSVLEHVSELCLNENGDPHASFCALHLTTSPDTCKLLVSTDSSQAVVFKMRSWTRELMISGLDFDFFHLPCACWHPDSVHAYAATPSGHVLLCNTQSGAIEQRYRAHNGRIRRIMLTTTAWPSCLESGETCIHIFTCSFDKSVVSMVGESASIAGQM